MEVALLLNKENGHETGNHFVVLNKKDCQVILAAMTNHCAHNKRDRAAKKLLKQMESTFNCF